MIITPILAAVFFIVLGMRIIMFIYSGDEDDEKL